jgi:solute carrier family 25 (mitochondrial S-adenosylmethionine transporter), member 26
MWFPTPLTALCYISLIGTVSSLANFDHSHLISLQQVIGHLDIPKYALEGAVAGGCRGLARGLTFPFDTIKTLEQVDRSDDILSKKEGDSDEAYFAKIFRGITPAVVSAIPANAAFFIVYKSLEVISESCYPFPSKLMERIFISSVATFPQNSIKIPFENVKQKMQTSSGMSRAEIIVNILKYQGVKGFFIGGNAQLLRELPYNAIQMSVFELSREMYHSNPLVHIGNFDEATLSAVSGFIACGIAALLTQPADVIKTKIMANDESLRENAVVESSNVGTIVRNIYEKEGLKGFFVGLLPRLALVSIGGMIYFWAATLVEQMLDAK